MTGGGPGPEIDLIRDGAETASAKLRFYRVAFGAGGAQPMNLAEVGRIAADGRRGGRVAVMWSPEGTATRSEVRLAFLAILCIESALPAGGQARVTRDSGGWKISASGRTLRCEPTMWSVLSGGAIPPDIDAARVHFALAAAAAAEPGMTIETSVTDKVVSIVFPAAPAA